MTCFDKAEELLTFVTEGYTILLAMKECIGMEEDEIPEDDWFCSETCNTSRMLSKIKSKKTIDNFRDLKNEYCKGLLWRGINNIARRGAVKENNGLRMIRHWKFDLFEFFLQTITQNTSYLDFV